jgi:hypothetical protein
VLTAGIGVVGVRWSALQSGRGRRVAVSSQQLLLQRVVDWLTAGWARLLADRVLGSGGCEFKC